MFLFKKEKAVVELIIRHAEKTDECLLTTIKTLKAYLEDDIDSAKELARQTDHVETEADLIRHQIKDKLFSGAYMPLIREDIFRLVQSMDTVANAAEKCCDFFLNQRPRFPDDLKPLFLEVVKESLGIGKLLREAVLCYLRGECPIEESRHHSKEIGFMESEVDRLEWDLTKEIFTSNIEFAQKIHLRRCLNSIVAVSDLAEDAAEQLDLVILKSMI
jgi:predicted phosphate transport protein (TIGR00153 family)